MTWEVASEVILDALKDSALVFAFVFVLHVLISFIDHWLSNFLVRRKKTGPLFGAIFGLIPQCGTSVLGSDLYLKKYITMGTLIAIFLSCSDEAIIAILTHGGDKAIMVLPLMGVKLLLGASVGFIVDLILLKRQKTEDVDEVEENKTCEIHHHENNKLHQHLFHPLIHSLEIFAYVLVINLALGFIIAAVGEEAFSNFLLQNKYLTPLLAPIIGLIPNCASSLLLSELFVAGSLSFGSLVGGLLVNSGLGMMLLIRKRESWKQVLIILAICFLVSIISGYIICLIMGF